MKIVTRMVTPQHDFSRILREACPSEASFIKRTPYWSWGRSWEVCTGGGGGTGLQSTFLTAFSGDFGPLGGVTHFPASRQAYMECFEGGRGVFSRVPPVRLGKHSMSQTQNPGNPGVLRHIPDQTGGFSGPKGGRVGRREILTLLEMAP